MSLRDAVYITLAINAVNALASVARTLWHWEKRRDYKRRAEATGPAGKH